MTLNTKRLTLKFVSNENIKAIHYLHSRPEIDQFNTLGIPESLEKTEEVVKTMIFAVNSNPIKKYTFYIESILDKQFIGLIGLNLGKEKYQNAEVWFKIDPKFWNQGYATESLKKIVDFGFEKLLLHRIEAGCAIQNFGSIAVLEKVGMFREAHTRQLLPLQSGWSDNYGYAILSTDKRL